MKKRTIIALLCLACILAAVFGTGAAFAEGADRLDYADAQNWAYCDAENTELSADVFFLCPSAFGGKAGAYNMDLTNEKGRSNFTGAIAMEKGIYDQNARFFAPFYRQVGYNVYALPAAEVEPFLNIAYRDVKDAFCYYLEHYNGGRPIVLAGFSQGADMALRLMKDVFDDEALQQQLVACYAIGWRVTQQELDTCPQLKMAEGEKDTGVIVAFNSEAEDVQSSLMIPEGVRTFAINPLNWKTDGTAADKSENLGACFTDYSGAILEEVPALTGAYIDPVRGALKVTDIDPEVYNATISILSPGVYHLYDYQFFYRNLQQNVLDRIAAYTGEAPAALDEERFEELIAANSIEELLKRHDSVRIAAAIFADGEERGSQTVDLSAYSVAIVYNTGYATYISRNLDCETYGTDFSQIMERLHPAGDYDELLAQSKNISIVDKPELEQIRSLREEDGVITVETASKDPDYVRQNLYMTGAGDLDDIEGVTLVFLYRFDAETGDLLRAKATRIDADGGESVINASEFAYDGEAFDPAGENSPFAAYFAEGQMLRELTIVYAPGTPEEETWRYNVPDNARACVVYQGEYANVYSDPACTQPFEGYDGVTPAYTIYVKAVED